MTELTDDETKKGVEITINAAQKTARKFGFKIGSTVAHINDPFAYKILSLLEHELLVSRPVDPNIQDGEQIVKTIPMKDAFDPNMARRGGHIVGHVLRARKNAEKNI